MSEHRAKEATKENKGGAFTFELGEGKQDVAVIFPIPFEAGSVPVVVCTVPYMTSFWIGDLTNTGFTFHVGLAPEKDTTIQYVVLPDMNRSAEDLLPEVDVLCLQIGRFYALESWLGALSGLDYPKNKMHLIFHDASESKPCKDMMRQWLEQNTHLYGSVEYIECRDELPLLQDPLGKIHHTVHGYQHIFSKNNSPYVLSLEDDVIPPRDALKRLLAGLEGDARAGAIAAKVLERPSSQRTGVIAWHMDRKPIAPGSTDLVWESKKIDYIRNEGREAVGAAHIGFTLLRRALFDGFSFQNKANTGPDILIARHLYEADKRFLLDWSLSCVHLDERAQDEHAFLTKPLSLPPVDQSNFLSTGTDFAAITCYFNPCGYRKPYENYQRFRESLARDGCELFTIELAFGDAPYELEPSDHVFQLRTDDILWHKERLLNVLALQLPQRVQKIAWIDGDIIFSRPDWHKEASRLLEKYPVVQLFSEARWLHESGGIERRAESVAAAAARGEQALNDFSRFHPGFAWAARREFFEKFGLYDRNIIGSGDSLMVYSFFGRLEDVDLKTANHAQRNAFDAWDARVRPYVGRSVGCVDAVIFHLWHGSYKNRFYDERMAYIKDFDPEIDLVTQKTDVYHWSDHARQNKQGMIESIRSYFSLRKEDEGYVVPASTQHKRDRGIVTAVDSQFFRAFRWWATALERVSLPITIFDVGLHAEERIWCRQRGMEVVDFDPFSYDGINRKQVVRVMSKKDAIIWTKPFMIARSPYKHTLWVDVDALVVGDIAPLFDAIVQCGIAVMPDAYRPDSVPNDPQLYQYLKPIGSSIDAANEAPIINAGIIGLDLEASRELLELWQHAVHVAMHSEAIAAMIRWYDQGCLIWALAHLPAFKKLSSPVFNTPPNEISGSEGMVRKDYRSSVHFIDEVKKDHPGAAIVHWMGKGKFDLWPAHSDEKKEKVSKTQKKKILVVNHQESYTGAPAIAFEVALKLQETYEVYVVSKEKGSAHERFASTFNMLYPTELYPDLTAKEYAQKIVEDYAPDLVYANTIGSYDYCVAAKQQGVKSVLHVHELDGGFRWASHLGILEDDPKLFEENFDALVCPSVAVAQYLHENFPIAKGKLSIVHEFIDVEEVKRKSSLQLFPADKFIGRFQVVACGTADRRKGFDRFLALASRLPHVGFCWIGKLSSMPNTAPRNVQFLGELQNPFPLVSFADVFVLSSREDPFPLVVLEAMALGKLVLAARDSGGAAEAIGREGIVLDTFDIDQAAEAIRVALADRTYLDEVGSRASQRVTRLYGAKTALCEVERIIARVLE